MNAKCEYCGGSALTESELVEAGQRAGIRVVDDTVFVAVHDAERGNLFENQKGFECTQCGNVYCMGCIMSAAPSHSNGGKACFDCRSNFRRLN